MLMAAWILAHDEIRFWKVKDELGCPLGSPLSESSSEGDRLKFFAWLSEKSANEEKYNIHAVWLWYYRQKFGDVLSFESISEN